MKLKKNYVLRRVANTWVVLPLDEETVEFSGMMKLNETGALIWRTMEKNGDRYALVAALTAEYAVSREQAEADVEEFLRKLTEAGCIEA